MKTLIFKRTHRFAFRVCKMARHRQPGQLHLPLCKADLVSFCAQPVLQGLPARPVAGSDKRRHRHPGPGTEADGPSTSHTKQAAFSQSRPTSFAKSQRLGDFVIQPPRSSAFPPPWPSQINCFPVAKRLMYVQRLVRVTISRRLGDLRVQREIKPAATPSLAFASRIRSTMTRRGKPWKRRPESGLAAHID